MYLAYSFVINSAFQLWCIEAKVNEAAASATDADVVLELSLSAGTTCMTDSLNSWKDDFEVRVLIWSQFSSLNENKLSYVDNLSIKDLNSFLLQGWCN